MLSSLAKKMASNDKMEDFSAGEQTKRALYAQFDDATVVTGLIGSLDSGELEPSATRVGREDGHLKR